jgi:hypothetical protein
MFEDRHGCGVHVGGNDLFGVREDVDHVGTVLSGAHDPVDFAGARVIASDGPGRFGSEPDFALREGEAMRTAERAEVDLGFFVLANEVDDGEGVRYGRQRRR